MTYRFLPHTADIRVSIETPSLREVYADAARLLRELLVGASDVAARESRDIAVTGTDTGETLLHFLQELLYAFEIDRFVPAAFEVRRAAATSVVGVVRGERFDPGKHETQPEVKAVTRHELSLEPTTSGWRAEVVFDV